MTVPLLVLVTCVAAGAGPPPSGPSMFVDSAELREIRQLAADGREPWSGVLRALREQSAAYLAAAPSPVKGEFRYRPSFTLLTAPRPGDPSDEDRLRRDSRIVRDLGLAYGLTSDEAYARKAAEFVAVWVKSMEPKWPYDAGDNGPMAVNTSLPAMFYGWDLIAGSQARTPELDDAMRTWAASLADTCKVHYSQIGVPSRIGWTMTLLVTASVISGRPVDRDFVWGKTDNEDTFQNLIPLLFETTGMAKPSVLSAQPLSDDDATYTGLRMVKSLVYVAEVARHQGVDLYNYESEGRGLRRSLTAYAPYFSGERRLPGVKGFPLGRDADAAVFEVAHSEWPDRVFEKVVQYLDRPGYDPDIMGPVGLTHRYRGRGSEGPTTGPSGPAKAPAKSDRPDALSAHPE